MLLLLVRLEDGALERLLEVRHQVAGVAAEDLVAALAAEARPSPACARVRETMYCGKRPGPADRLVHVVDELRQQVARILLRRDDLVQLGAAGAATSRA